MAYEKQTWIDHYTDDEGNVVQQGTFMDAEHFNHMEDGIKEASDHAENKSNPHGVTAAQLGFSVVLRKDDEGYIYIDDSDEATGSGSGGVSIAVDTEMSDTSSNAVQNKVIKAYVDDKFSAVDGIDDALEKAKDAAKTAEDAANTITEMSAVHLAYDNDGDICVVYEDDDE